MRPDAAAELVAAYLKVNGYLTISDLEIHRRDEDGYHAITDVDVVGLRPPILPGPTHYGSGVGAAECPLMEEVDPALDVPIDRFDVIIGEVKRGEAALNPGLRDPHVLHAVMRRVGDVFEAPSSTVIDALVTRGRASTSRARARLVAFGSRGLVAGATTVHLAHIVDWLDQRFDDHAELLEVTAFSDPVLSILSLVHRLGRPLGSREPASTWPRSAL